MSVLVLGLGNPLRGDDGIGPRVVKELTHRGLPEGVMALDGGAGGLDLLPVLEGGTRFTPAQARLTEAADRFSLHHAGLSEVLALANALGQALPEMVIFGVQPAEVGWKEGLSPAVEAMLPVLTDAVLKEIAGSLPVGLYPRGECYAQDSGD